MNCYVRILCSICVICVAGSSFGFGARLAFARVPKRLALAIGISEYQSIKKLTYAHSDALQMSAFLKRHGFEVTTLINQDASKRAILKAMKQLRDRAQPGDKVVFYYSGHGTTLRLGKDSHKCQGAILPYHTKMVAKKTFVVDSVLTTKKIAGWAKSFRTSHVLFLFDSCFSGHMAPAGGARGKFDRGDGPTPRFVASRSSCSYKRRKRNRSIQFVPRSSKYTLFSASDKDQFAYEDKYVKGGYFTYMLLKAFKKLQKRPCSNYRELMREMMKVAKKKWRLAQAIPRIQQPQIIGRPTLPLFFGGPLIGASRSCSERDKRFCAMMTMRRPGSRRKRVCYPAGKRVRLSVKLTKSAYVAICGRSTEGKKGRFFPNRYHRSFRLRAGRTYVFPPNPRMYGIKAYGPPGTALFWLVADRKRQPRCGKVPKTKAVLRRIAAGSRGGFGVVPGKRVKIPGQRGALVVTWTRAMVAR